MQALIAPVMAAAGGAAPLAYMAQAGFDAARLTPIGLGPDQPSADNATAEGRAANRRIEFNILERSE